MLNKEKNEEQKLETKQKSQKEERQKLLSDFNRRIRKNNQPIPIPDPNTLSGEKPSLLLTKYAWGVDQRKFQSRENSSSCGNLHRKKEKMDSEEKRDMMG